MRHVLLAAALLGPAVLAGCMGAQNCDTTGTNYNCQFGGSGTVDRSDTWQNPTGQARVQFQMGGTGDVTVTITDAGGTQVFHQSYSNTGGAQDTSNSESGQPGDWTVRIQGSYSGGAQVTIQSI